jgi:hypothetical protein
MVKHIKLENLPLEQFDRDINRFEQELKIKKP